MKDYKMDKEALGKLITAMLEDDKSLHTFVFFLNTLENIKKSTEEIQSVLNSYLYICRDIPIKGKKSIREIGDRYILEGERHIGFINAEKIEYIANAVLHKSGIDFPIDIHDFKRRYKNNILKHNQEDGNYKKLMQIYQDGDVIYEQISPYQSWINLCGSAGVVLKRDGEVISIISKDSEYIKLKTKSKKCGFCASVESDNNPLIAGDETYICSDCVLSAHKIFYGVEDSSKCILDYATEIINNSEAILVLAGAGMSADSNLPTYRDKEGFWNDYPPYMKIKKDYVAMTSPYGFSSDPHFAWGFFAQQYKLYKNAVPHDGYLKLLKLFHLKKDYFVVTTNVDGLFIKSGFSKENLHEAHGSIHKLQCSRPCHRDTWEIESLNVEIDYSTMNALDPLPLCQTCGAVSRPNIFMFGDTDESYIWEESQESAKRFREWRQKNLHKKIVILEIGVGAEGLKRHVKQYYQEFSDTTLIRINPEFDTSYRNEDIFYLSMSAKEAFLTLTREK